MNIEPVTRPSLVDQVVERVRDWVAGEGLKPGDRLPSAPEFCQKLGVSLSVVREAVGRLEGLGLVTIQHGRGMFVGDRTSLNGCARLLRSAMEISPRELSKFLELRAAVECQAARRAAQVAAPETLAELQSLVEQMDALQKDPLEAIKLDFRFHLQIVEMGGNELMVTVMELLQEFILASMVQTTSPPGRRERRARLHQDVVDAIRSGDPDVAEKEMRRHMARVERDLKELEGRR